jgi:hypothetical protein
MARDGLLPPLFGRVHGRFRTPHVSTILTGVFVAGFAAVASLDEMVDLTNIGTLFAFILVCAGIIVLRVREPGRPRPFRVPGGWTWSLALYIAFAIGVVLISASAGHAVVGLALGALAFAVLRNHVFPVLGILSCLYLIWYLPPTSWLRFAAWLNCGFVIYASYGALNSRLAKAHDVHAGQRDAHTAYTGAWLGVLGTGALFATRGLDLWLEALRHHQHLSGRGGAKAALAQVTSVGPWLGVSWFLIVPLTLTALVLCPTIALRARRAAAQALGGDVAATARAAQVLAVGLAAVTLAYLASVVGVAAAAR